MWWPSMLGASLLLLGCTRPNPAFGVGGGGGGGEGGSPDGPPAEVGREAPAPDQATFEGSEGDLAADSPGAEGPGDAAALDQSPSIDAATETPLPVDQVVPVDVRPSRLVAHWAFDEESGTTASDSSENRYHGVLEGFGGGTGWTDTPRGGGLTFTGNLNQGVRVGSAGAVPPKIQALARFTIAAWTYRAPGNTGLHMSVMSRQRDGNTETFNLTFDNALAKLYVYPETPGNTLEATATLTTGAAGGAWVHLAATYDGTQLRVYVDGVAGGGTVTYNGALTASQFPLYIGTNKNDPAANQPFEGILDEVLLFSEALSVEEIRRVRGGDLGGL